MKYGIETADNGWIVNWWEGDAGEELIRYQHGFTYSHEPDRTDREDLMEEIKCFSEMCRYLAGELGLNDNHDDTHRLILAVVTQDQWGRFVEMVEGGEDA